MLICFLQTEGKANYVVVLSVAGVSITMKNVDDNK